MNEWLERYKVHIMLALGLVAIVGLALFLTNRPRPAPIIISTPVLTSTPTAVPTLTPSPIRVYMTGGVQNPDVYILPPGSIVKDALAAAGGATADADLDRINLALVVYDQQQIYVPRKGETNVPVATASPLTAAGQAEAGKININQATVEELDTLPGIGPAIAQRIVDYRNANGPFATIEDLLQVKGIGPAIFDKLKDKITTG